MIHRQFNFYSNNELYKRNPNDRFVIRYPRCQRPPQSWRSECLAQARYLAIEKKHKCSVLLSGGIDSEVVVRAFHESGSPFQITILRMKDGLNSHDLEWALEICEDVKVKPEFIDIDLAEFYGSLEILEIAKKMQISAAMNLLQCKMMIEVSRRGYFPITGNGDILIRYFRDGWYIHYTEVVSRLALCPEIYKFEGCPFFFQANPELLLSYLMESELTSFAESFTNKSSNWNPVYRHFGYYPPEDKKRSEVYRPIKLGIYQKNFSVKSRPKYTGFEKADQLEKEVSVQLDKYLTFPNEHLFYSYESLMRALTPL